MKPWSPPTRGCSVLVVRQGIDPVVVPADAGVFREVGEQQLQRQRGPRRRGGVPCRGRAVRRRTWWSPPTRGCSDQACTSARRRCVVPADAGVFRLPTARRLHAVRGPRRRGGVPAGASDPEPTPPWSPPTRGCSDIAKPRRSGAGVVPADAGVFRHPGQRHVLQPSGPRRRGGVPEKEGETYTVETWSPPTRGCSVAEAYSAMLESVVPADAGVFLGRRCSMRPPSGGSR